MLGGFWVVVQTEHGEMMGMKMENVLTLGYDPEKKKYIGQWVDSMMPHAWKYEGEVDESGRKITLHTSGPSPKSPGKTCKFLETFEFRVRTNAFSRRRIRKTTANGRRWSP